MVRSPPLPRCSILPLCSAASPSVAETHQENGRIVGSVTEERAQLRGGSHLHRPLAAALPRPAVSCCGPAARGDAADGEETQAWCGGLLGTSNLHLLNMNNYNGKKNTRGFPLIN